MRLHDLKPSVGAKKKAKRVGRGESSGWGKTAGRGEKGQKSRSGGKVPVGFEGGQMPLYRRLPKRGFTNIFKKEYALVNIKDLDRFEANSVVDAETLVASGLVRTAKLPIKLLATGELKKSLTVKLQAASKAAVTAIEEAGGNFELTNLG